jgi:5'-nucleotidase (lipoprotein e(P4) family)
MKQILKNKKYLLVLVILFALISVITSKPKEKIQREPKIEDISLQRINLSQFQKYITSLYESGEIDSINYIATNLAKEYINRNIEKYSGKNPSIVFDLDETLLSNFNTIRKMKFAIDWNKISYDSCELIKPTYDLYNYALKNDIKIIFITARNEVNRKSTVNNLKNLGINKWDTLFFMPQNSVWSDENALNYKINSRKAMTELGYSIMISIGDKATDFKGGYCDTAFKLVNVLY